MWLSAIREGLERRLTSERGKGTEKNLVELQSRSALFSATFLTWGMDTYRVAVHEFLEMYLPFRDNSYPSVL